MGWGGGDDGLDGDDGFDGFDGLDEGLVVLFHIVQCSLNDFDQF